MGSAEMEEQTTAYGAEWFLEYVSSMYSRVFPAPQEEGDTKMSKAAAIIRRSRGVDEDDGPDEGDMVWVDRPMFDIVFVFIIILNAVVIGLEVDLVDPEERDWWALVLEGLFAFAFAIEVICKVRYKECAWVAQSPWHFAQLLITVLVCLDFLLYLLFLAIPDVDYESHGYMRMLSLLRILWIFRLSKLFRSRSFEEMRLMVEGVKVSFAIIVWVSLLMVVSLYIGAVFMTTEVGHNIETYSLYRKVSGGWDHEEYFGTVLKSMYTLFQCITLDRWSSDIARHVVQNQWYMSCFFLLFLLLTSFGLLNVVVSVFVEHTISAAASNDDKNRIREEKRKKEELMGLQEIFNQANEDGDDYLDLQEFQEAAKKPSVILKLNEIELDKEDAESLFQQLDGNGSKALTIKEFVDSCTRLKGPAMSKDMLAIQAQAETLEQKMIDLARTLAKSESMMGRLDEITTRIETRFSSAIKGSREKIADRVGGAAPVVQPKRTRPGAQEGIDLSIGNRPAVPLFPNRMDRVD